MSLALRYAAAPLGWPKRDRIVFRFCRRAQRRLRHSVGWRFATAVFERGLAAGQIAQVVIFCSLLSSGAMLLLSSSLVLNAPRAVMCCTSTSRW
jgi:hypothetical protein